MKKENKIERYLACLGILAGIVFILLPFTGLRIESWSVFVGAGFLLIGGIGLGATFTMKGVALDIKDMPRGLRLRVVSVLSDGKSMIAHELDDQDKPSTEPYFIREVTLPSGLSAGSICFVDGHKNGGRWISFQLVG